MAHDILIISAFGRGHWLAAEMAEKGRSVHLLDVSQTMGRWTPEDREGPFGLFMSDHLTDLQKERLIEEDYLDPVDHGFTTWLKDGPLEARGPLFSYRFQRKGYSEKLKEYLLHSEVPHKNNLHFTEEKRFIETMDFKENWLAHLAHQLSSTVFKNNPHGMSCNDPLPLMSSHTIRRASRRGYQKNCDWLKSKGVDITRPIGIKDIIIEKNQCRYIKLTQNGGAEGSAAAKQFIWCLSSEESEYLLPTGINKKLFPKGSIQPQWSWFRYRIQLEPNDWLEVLPLKFLIIEEIDLPWTHTNLCMVQKTVQEYEYDVWLRLPNSYRNDKPSFEEMSKDLLSLFKKKIPYVKFKGIQMPQEYHYSNSELGPGLFPVYREEFLRKLKPISLRNLCFDGPEMWTSLDWGGQFKHQAKILSLIEPSSSKKDLRERGSIRGAQGSGICSHRQSDSISPPHQRN